MKIVAKRDGMSEQFWNGYWDRLDYAGNHSLSADSLADYVAGWNEACEAFPNVEFKKLESNGLPKF